MPYTHIGKRYILILSFLLVIFLVVVAAGIFWIRSLQAQSAFTQVVVQLNPYHYTPKGEIEVPSLKQTFFHDPSILISSSLAPVRGVLIPTTTRSEETFFSFVEQIKKQNPSVVLVLGSTEALFDGQIAVTTDFDWVTPSGLVRSDRKIIKSISEEKSVHLDESLFSQNPDFSFFMPALVERLPNTRVVPLLVNNTLSQEEADQLVHAIHTKLPSDVVVFSSLTFKTFPDASISFFQQEREKNMVKTFSLEKIKLNGFAEHYFFLKLMQERTSEKVLYEMKEQGGFLFGEGVAVDLPQVNILQFGDLMLDRQVSEYIKSFGPDYPFEKIGTKEKGVFSQFDILTANLEGPFADTRRQTSKTIAFRFDPALIPMLTKYHFNLFNLANNHSLDMGKAGFEESKKNLAEAGIGFYGAPLQVSDEDSVFVKEVSGKRIAFVGVDDTLAPVDLEDMKSILQNLQTHVDYTLVNIHWGVEYKTTSNPRQQMLAHAFIDAGADAVIGHHPHVVEEMEIYRSKPIFYSLGNFVFDQYFSDETQKGLGIGLILSDENISVYPFPLTSRKSQVDLMDTEQAHIFMQNFISQSRLAHIPFENFHFEIPQNNTPIP